MEPTNLETPTVHPHSKTWLVVTILVALVAACLIWYFLYPRSDSVALVPETQETAKNETAETLVAATEELNAANVDELKTAVDELKATLDSFE